jgi:hypothetical protein
MTNKETRHPSRRADLVWHEARARPGLPRLAGWKRRAAIAPDGAVFIPACAVPDHSEQAVALCAMYDGVSLVIADDQHLYFPVEWIAREFPAAAEVARKIEKRLRGGAPSSQSEHHQEDRHD